MSIITEYLDEIYISALGHPAVTSVQKIRTTEDISRRVGVYRYRIHLANGTLLEMTERVIVESGKCVVTKYRHHWQDESSVLKKRWDNSPHHPQLDSFPHHVHDGSEENVKSHPPVNGLAVLQLVLDTFVSTEQS